MITVPINKIIDLSSVDGIGLRSAIFVQKCNIHCLYCHNPETQNLCLNCKECVSCCPKKALYINKDGKVQWNPTICVFCDTCLKVCKHNASPRIEYLSSNEVYARIKKNIGFIRGITVSGGECSLYPQFLEELFILAKKDNLTCLLDSNGMIDYSLYPSLMNLTDGVMLDIKSWNEDIYYKLTGYSNKIVKKNLSFLDTINKIEELRLVVLPSYTDSKDSLLGISKTIKKDHIKNMKIKLIRFRNNGVKGILKENNSPSLEYMNELKEYANSLGFENIVIV